MVYLYLKTQTIKLEDMFEAIYCYNPTAWCSCETQIFNLFIREGYIQLYVPKHMAKLWYVWDILDKQAQQKHNPQLEK